LGAFLARLGLRAEMFGGVGRALASPYYRKYACGHVPNVFGWWTNRLGIGWLTWELTGSAGWLGIVTFAGMIPVALVAPVSGVLADRYGHREVAIAAGVLGGLVTATIALLALGGLMTVTLLIGLSAAQGFFFGMEFPARQALIPQLCKRENVPAALAFNATTFQVGTFLGPVLAGWLIARWGSGASILAFAFTNFWMALMILTLRFRPEPKEPSEPTGILADIRAGFVYLLGLPPLRLLFVMSLTSGILLRPYTEMRPAFAADVFGGGPGTLGALNASAGLGALVCAVFLAFRGRTRGLAAIMLAGAACGSAGIGIFTRVGDLHIAMVVLGLTAMMLLAAHVGAYSLVQNVTDPRMRGRVISIAVSISVGGPALGALMIGWLAELIGLQDAVGVSSLLALAIVLTALPFIRRRTAEIEGTGGDR
jgi:MFS family permease